jgi:hypothetical protein
MQYAVFAFLAVFALVGVVACSDSKPDSITQGTSVTTTVVICENGTEVAHPSLCGAEPVEEEEAEEEAAE